MTHTFGIVNLGNYMYGDAKLSKRADKTYLVGKNDDVYVVDLQDLRVERISIMELIKICLKVENCALINNVSELADGFAVSGWHMSSRACRLNYKGKRFIVTSEPLKGGDFGISYDTFKQMFYLEGITGSYGLDPSLTFEICSGRNQLYAVVNDDYYCLADFAYKIDGLYCGYCYLEGSRLFCNCYLFIDDLRMHYTESLYTVTVVFDLDERRFVGYHFFRVGNPNNYTPDPAFEYRVLAKNVLKGY